MARGGSPGRTSRRASAPHSRSRSAPSSGARAMVDHAARRPAPARAPQPQGGEASGCGDEGRLLRPDRRDGGAVRDQGQSGAYRGARRRGRHGVGTEPGVPGGVDGGSAGAPESHALPVRTVGAHGHAGASRRSLSQGAWPGTAFRKWRRHVRSRPCDRHRSGTHHDGPRGARLHGAHPLARGSHDPTPRCVMHPSPCALSTPGARRPAILRVPPMGTIQELGTFLGREGGRSLEAGSTPRDGRLVLATRTLQYQLRSPSKSVTFAGGCEPDSLA